MKYRYRTDEEMKDSGIEWIGKIPKDWDISKWGYVTKILTDYTANGSFGDLAKNVKYLDYKEYARLVRLVDLRDNLNNQGIYVTKKAYDYLSKSSLYGDEFLIANVGANSGFVCKMPKVNYPCTLAPNMMMARFYEDKVDNDFMIYSANSSSIKTQLLAKATQSSAQPKLNKDDFRTTKFARPSLEMQRLIVQFLDEKISQFDSIISKKESLIEKLEEAKKSLISEVVTGKVKVVKTEEGYNVVPRKPEEMKDSGVEWLGLVPKEWNVKRLRFLGTLQNGISKSSDEFGYGFPFVSYGDVYRNLSLPKFVSGLVNSSDTDRKIYSVEEGDVFFTRTSETINEIGISSVCLETIPEATFAGFLIRFRPNNKLLFKGFSKYYFRCILNRNYFVKEMNLVTRASLSQNLLNNLSVVLPTYEEQENIYWGLEYKIGAINNIIEKINSEIQKLKEAKQSLITEAVTGKIEILD